MNTTIENDLFDVSLQQLEFERIIEQIARYASSSLGTEHIIESRPLTDPEAIRNELRMVGEARAILSADKQIPLVGLYDIRKALSLATVSGNWLAAEDLRAVYTTIQGIRLLKEFFGNRAEASPLLHELTEPIHVSRLLEKHLSDAIDESGQVRDTASRELFNIRRDIIAKSGALRERLGKILRRVAEDELLTDEYVTLREGRLVLPVRVEYKRRIPGIIHGESQSGSTVYLEPAEIFDMNNEISELTFAERREVERILRTLTEELGSEASEFRESLWRVQLVDSINARARYAEKFDCVEPELTTENRILLEDARHPLLQLRLDSVIPMTLELDEESQCLIISGPNAGGKTIAIKTFGMITMMALSGIHPPATRCIVHPCRLFSDIGDRQSVENDLSTFSAHMTRVQQIMSSVRTGDVVLLDELGTGTDPDEGAAIAAAVLDRLLERGAIVLATTHHSALKVFAYERSNVLNAGMEFNTDELTPTYRLMVGIPGNSYAFELLERFGFDPDIIQTARGNLGEERGALSNILSQLEESLNQSRRLEAEGRRKVEEAESLREKYESAEERLRERRDDVIREARQQAQAELAEANSLIENTLREIRSGASNDAIREMRKTIEESRVRKGEQLAPKKPDRTAGEFLQGDRVRLKDGHEVGELEFDPDDEGNVVIQFGSLRMRSNVGELVLVNRAERRRMEQSKTRNALINAEEVRTTIDVRGKYSDEAAVEIEQALSSALSNGIHHLEIIHGKGTGALRKKTHELLQGHPHVESFRLGTLTEGGAGITVVELV